MTTDADIDRNKVVDAAVDNDVDRIIELDPDMTYIRSYVDNMDIVDESFRMLSEANIAKIPEDFVKFAKNVMTDLADRYDQAAYKLNTDVKAKAKTQYKIIINKANEDADKIKEDIARKFNLTKLYEDGKEIIYGKLSDGKEYIYSIKTSVLDKKDKIIVSVTCHKLDKSILKKLSDEGKDILKKAKTSFDKYLEGDYGKTPVIDYTAVREQETKERSHDNDYLKLINEYCDLSDPEFRKKLVYVNEAEQNKVLMSLTAKLYATIVDKANEIDFGDIPNTKGDITKLNNYNTMVETVATLRDIVKEYKQDPKAVNVISEAIANVETRKDEFTKAFRLGYEIPKLLYCTMVLAIVDSITYMIASCIEFIKTPKSESFDMVLDVMRYKKAREYLVFSNLEKLNGEFKNGHIDKILKEISNGAIKNSNRPVNEIAFLPTLIIGAIVAALVFIIMGLFGLLQSIAFCIYNAKNRYSEYFELQAMVLEANANSLDLNHPDWSDDKKKDVYNRQMKVVEKWRKRAEKWRITAKDAEIKTQKELSNTKKMDADEFEDATKFDSSLF